MGVSLRQIIPQIVGKKVTSYFELVKPLIEFNFENIESRSNNMFELATQEEISKLQGQSWRQTVCVFFRLALRDRNMHVRFFGRWF